MMLTDVNCRAIINRARNLGKPIKKADGNGLFLFAKPNGKAYWRYKYRLAGKGENLISFGPYPLVSLSEARAKHNEAYTHVTKGSDPSRIRQEQARQATREACNTFEAIGRAWHSHNLEKWSPDHADKILHYLQKDLFNTIGHVPVTELTRKQVLDALRDIEGRGAHNTARRSRQFATCILNHACDEEYITVNVALGLENSLKAFRRGHYPSMDIDELPVFLRKLDKSNISHDVKDAIELLMLTLVRRNELIKATWDEFDMDKGLWVIPAPRMKMRREHIVPLSKQAIQILQKRKRANALLHEGSNYVFASSNKPNKHICLSSPGNAIKAIGYKDRHTPHGFRALGMGIAKEKLHYRHEVPDRQLAHVPASEVDRAYDRAKFLPERMKMMQELADYIDGQRQ